MGFFDLNIPYHESDRRATDKSSLRGRRLKLALKTMELGYTGIAYNRTLKGVMSEADRCATPLFPITKLTPSSSAFFASVKLHRELLNVAFSSPFRQYTRLTVIVDIPSQALALNAGNPILRSYDIVAVRPMNQNAFDQTCHTSEVDIIAVDFSEKLPFRLKQPMVKAAIKRGVYFEITYSGLIADAQSRRQMISNCKLLVDWTRGKNLILCSAATSATELRGPQDVANLFSLLGLSSERAKAAVSKNCRSLLANALRKKHFYKEAVKVEQIPSSGPQSAFDDWLKWDPISSGAGDLLLDDMEKSFSISETVKENVKTINFTSNINGIPANGLQIKDLISVTKEALDPPDTDNCTLAVMETERYATVENPEVQGGLTPMHEEQSTTPENQEGQTSSYGARDIHLGRGTQDSDVSLDFVPETVPAVQLLTGDGQACIDDAKIGHQISDFEDSARPSLPSYNVKSTDSEGIVQISDEKLKHSTFFEANVVNDINMPITNNHVSLELSNPLVISKSASTAFPLESTVENQFDMDLCAHEGVTVDKVPDKIDIENIPSSNVSSQGVYVEGHYTKTSDNSVKFGDGLPMEGHMNLTTYSSELIKDDMMGERMQIDPATNYQRPVKLQAGKQSRKRDSPHKPLLFPFKRLLKPRPFRRKSRK